MRIVFIGCVEFSYRMLEDLLAYLPQGGGAEVVGIITRKASAFNADFRSLEPLAEAAGVPLFFAEGNDQEAIAARVRGWGPDVIYCFGWTYLLRPVVLSVPPLGVVGYHPAALPRNRGRHPIIWALVLGLEETASTFFFMDEGADSGDLLSQERVPIDPADDAAALYEKLVAVAQAQMRTFTAQLASGRYPRIPQDHSRANYWRKRSKPDGAIDWRMSSRMIYNLVRALARPYVGAHTVFRDRDVKIWRVAVADEAAAGLQHLEPGKVLRASAHELVVRCGEGAVRILEHEFDPMPEEGAYL